MRPTCLLQQEPKKSDMTLPKAAPRLAGTGLWEREDATSRPHGKIPP
jgi:hypothetical protein